VAFGRAVWLAWKVGNFSHASGGRALSWWVHLGIVKELAVVAVAYHLPEKSHSDRFGLVCLGPVGLVVGVVCLWLC
jgi:hypothetical protein